MPTAEPTDEPTDTPTAHSTLTILSMAEGSVFVLKAGTGNWTEAQVGMSLGLGDIVKSGNSSSAEITFFDGSTIELQTGTQVEIASLNITSTGSTTIGLKQAIGTTISRVTELVDSASSYEIETPAGVAAVRGSVMTVRVTEDCETWITNQRGSMWGIAQGVELQIPVRRVCVIICGQPPRLVPLPTYERRGGGGGGGGDSGSTRPVTDLTIDKSDDADQVNPGSNIVYTLRITNNGPSDSTGAVVLDALPSAVSFVSATNGGTYDPGSHTVRWAIGALPMGSNTSVTVTVEVNESVTQGTITNTAMVAANERDSYQASNTATEDTPIDVNDPPAAADDAAVTDEDSPVTVAAPGILNNDSDPDAGDTLTVTAVDTSGTAGAVTAWNANGSFTYSPDGQFDYLKAGGSATDSFVYTLSDGKGGTDTATVTITITGANDAPANISLDTSSVAENQPVGMEVGTFSTTDPDAGDTFVYGLASGEGDDDNSSFTIASSKLLTATIFDYETKNSYSVRVRITDSGALHYETVFVITVTDVNDPPVAANDTATTSQNTAVTIDVLTNDSDPDGDTLTVDSVTQATNGSVINNGSDVTYTPDDDFTGTYSFTYIVGDGNGGTDTATVTVTVVDDIPESVSVTRTAYAAYEDREHGDFDYNDFGMNMLIEETSIGNCLTEINMQFYSATKLAGDVHDIHILRTLSANTFYSYTITRSAEAQGTETPEVTNESGQGDFDIVLFDTSFPPGDTVTIHIEIIDGCEQYNPAPWAYYDPYINNRNNGEHHIGDSQPTVAPLPPWPNGYYVPYILVIPVTGWQAPAEGQCITNLYQYFDDYYATGSPENWYE